MIVVLHRSASVFGDVTEINKWHKQRGFRMIGYHFVVLNGVRKSWNSYNLHDDGKIEVGRPINDNNILEPIEYGAHVRGLNDESIGICLIGDSKDFTMNQLITLEDILLPELRDIFGKIEIFQHSDFDKKKPFCAEINPNLIKKWNKIINL